MVEIELMTNDKEEKELLERLKGYIIRSDKIKVDRGYVVTLDKMRDGKKVLSQISRRKWLVTHIDTWGTAPIDEHTQIISLREVRA